MTDRPQPPPPGNDFSRPVTPQPPGNSYNGGVCHRPFNKIDPARVARIGLADRLNDSIGAVHPETPADVYGWIVARLLAELPGVEFRWYWDTKEPNTPRRFVREAAAFSTWCRIGDHKFASTIAIDGEMLDNGRGFVEHNAVEYVLDVVTTVQRLKAEAGE